LIKILDGDLHPHLKARMLQRGITLEEIETVLNNGWDATDAKPGTIGKCLVFRYNETWEGKFCEEKEASVYYKVVNNRMMLLTVKARYGKGFLKEGKDYEVGV
jgi:hypothetical protein